MALSKSALKRVIDSVPEGHDVGVWVVRVCRAVEAEVQKQDTELIRQLVDAMEGVKALNMGGELALWTAEFDRLLSAISRAGGGWRASHEQV